MSWLLNLFQLGRGTDPISQRSPNGVMGGQYNITAKPISGITTTVLDYGRGYMRSISRSISRGSQ
jgi:hypothetical protein